MKICFIISSLEIGGAQTFLVRLANYFSKELNCGVNVFNLDINNVNNSLENELSQGIIYQKYSFALKAPYFLRSQFMKYQVKKHLQEFKPDVINSHLFHADQLISRLKLPQKTPFVITDHGDYKNSNLNKKEKKRILSSADLIIANSQDTGDYLKKIFAVDSVVINNGYVLPETTEYLTRELLEIPENSFIYCMVARGIKEKGWMEAIKAFAMHKFYNQSFFIFVGDGEGVEEIKRYAKELAINNVKFVRYQINPIKFMRISDVVVLPSYFSSETLGLSLVESIFCEIPVIATDWGGMHQVIKNSNGDCGLLCSMKDGKADIESLAECMNIMHEQHQIYKNNTRHCKDKFSMQKCADRYQDYFLRELEK